MILSAAQGRETGRNQQPGAGFLPRCALEA
jgi:hypothetical protein